MTEERITQLAIESLTMKIRELYDGADQLQKERDSLTSNGSNGNGNLSGTRQNILEVLKTSGRVMNLGQINAELPSVPRTTLSATLTWLKQNKYVDHVGVGMFKAS